MTVNRTPAGWFRKALPAVHPIHHGLSRPTRGRASRQIQRGYPRQSPTHSPTALGATEAPTRVSSVPAPYQEPAFGAYLRDQTSRGWLTCSRGCGSQGGVPQSAARWISCCSCSCSPPSRKIGRDLAANRRDLAANGTPHLRIIGGNIGAPWTDARNFFSLGTCLHTLFSAPTASTGLE